jgi:hypothetical protein
MSPAYRSPAAHDLPAADPPGSDLPAAGPAGSDLPAAETRGGRFLVRLIVAYRRWLSPALPARCRFYPSCSAYAQEAIARYGAFRGTGLALRRLLRCHPFHPGGYDPVPAKHATGAAEC